MSSSDDKPRGGRRRALGRGLGALIPSQQKGGGSREYAYLPLESIEAASTQPRSNFNESGLRELADSIEESGLIQPLVVRETDDDTYELIAGERRWRACKMVGLTDVPAVIKDVSDAEAYALALVENIQREDLNPIEEASAYARLMEEFDLTQSELSEQVGKSRSTIANAVRLLTLPQKVCDMLAAGQLSAGHARTLVSLDSELAKRLANKIVKEGLSVREAEELAKQMKDRGTTTTQKKKKSSYRDDAQTRDITRKLQQSLGTKVKLKDKHGKGRIEIHYDDYDVLQGVLDRLDVNLG
ncbi:MAG: ParB/RepB/Spo0J family partition protein [Myxococcota bacterium]